ncbi:MAG: respiratory nitrate reductase subunit gamma [Acetobacteraceae bacterium]
MTPLHEFLFGIYPYICLTILFLGSIVRYDREAYSWKSDTSETLRRGQLRLGSNLFHYGIGVIAIGHFVGFLIPEPLVTWLLNPANHELLAMVSGGLAGVAAIAGLSILLHRRLADPRVRANTRKWDFTVLVFLLAQLGLGLSTIYFSAKSLGGPDFALLVQYVKGIVTFQLDAARLLVNMPLVYRIHILVGFTIFLISPFTRLVHIWSGLGALAYVVRPYQLVRSPRSPRSRKVSPL